MRDRLGLAFVRYGSRACSPSISSAAASTRWRCERVENWFALAVYSRHGSRRQRTGHSRTSTAVEAEEREREAAELAEETVEAQALRRSDAAKTNLLRAVSHDLRSPLTAIKAATEGLESTSFQLDDGERAELLAAIRLEAERLDRLVANLLDLSRLEVGVENANPELWSVDELVGRALDALGLNARRVTVSLPEQVPFVEVDAGQIERALVNMLENALKFSSPENAVSVAVDVGDDEVIVAVHDEGVGLVGEDLDALFEPFQRGTSGYGQAGAASDSRSYAGSHTPTGDVSGPSRPDAARRFSSRFPLSSRRLGSQLSGVGSSSSTTSRRSCARSRPPDGGRLRRRDGCNRAGGALVGGVQAPDALILDLVLPDRSGTDVTTRTAYVGAPCR